jgi:outer membrane protein OmpA-like peptidoglycan-associated protein
MLQVNTMYKLKTIVVCIGMLFSVSLFAQTEKTSEKSTIVMTKSELKSFLSTIAEARRAQLKEKDARQQKLYLAELRLKYQEQPEVKTGGYDNLSNQQILSELRKLNQRIDNLSASSNASPSMTRDNSTIIMPSSANPSPVYPSNDRSTATIIPSNKAEIKELQNQIDSLNTIDANKANSQKDNSLADSLNTMNGRLNDVRKQLESLESKLTTPDKVAKTDETSKDKTYFKQQVYFDNNSETLRTEYIPYIQDLTQILIKYPEAKVLLEGWASPLGKTTYNKQLSMRRAEAVEKAFINNRIDASRIISSFRGEDNTSSEQYARRVDMSIIVR